MACCMARYSGVKKSMFYIKRNGKLFGPFDVNAVAKSINFEIFTAMDMISEDQVTWITVEEFLSKQKIEKQVVPSPIPVEVPRSYSRVAPGKAPGMPQYNSDGMVQVGSQESTFEVEEYSDKCRRHYALWWLLGVFGAHDFYAGYTERGIIKLLLLFVPVLGWFASSIWLLIDLFSVSCDAKGRPFAPGGCKRVVYILLCVFAGAGGWHHLYAGHKVRWLVQLLVLIVLQIVYWGVVVTMGSLDIVANSDFNSMPRGVLIATMLLHAANFITWLVILVSAILTTRDADGYEFI